MCYHCNGKVLVSKEEEYVVRREAELGAVAGPASAEKTAKEWGISVKTVQHFDQSVLREALKTGATIKVNRYPYLRSLKVLELTNNARDSG